MHQSSTLRLASTPSILQPAEGFGSWTDFVVAVRKHAVGPRDPRLAAAAATAITKSGVGTDGGFAVPMPYGEQINNAVRSEKSLLTLTDMWFTEGNAINFPSDQTTAWGANGIKAHWVGEGEPIPQSKVDLQNVSARLDKVEVLLPVTEEMVNDALLLSQYLERKAPEAIDHAINMAIMRGTGAGTPLGVLNSPALVVVDKETSQTAATIVGANVAKMLARLPASSYPNAVWLVHPDALPQLPLLNVNGATLFAWAAGLPSGAVGLLLGRPVIPHQVCSTVGESGDIVLADFSQYMAAVKIGGLRYQISIHLWFDRDVHAYKFTLRVLGQPWLSAPIALRVGTMTQSPFVSLAARA